MSIPQIVAYVGYASVLLGVVGSLIKVTKILKDLIVGQQCELRSEITAIYYKHVDELEPTLREYERKNLDDLYAGYKALKGNHFIDDLYNKMREWKVVP